MSLIRPPGIMSRKRREWMASWKWPKLVKFHQVEYFLCFWWFPIRSPRAHPICSAMVTTAECPLAALNAAEAVRISRSPCAGFFHFQFMCPSSAPVVVMLSLSLLMVPRVPGAVNHPTHSRMETRRSWSVVMNERTVEWTDWGGWQEDGPSGCHQGRLGTSSHCD